MKVLIKILAVVLLVATVLVLSALLFFRWRRRRRELIPQTIQQFTAGGVKSRSMTNFLVPYTSSTSSRASLRFHHLHHHRHRDGEHNQQPPFNWYDHPRLVTEAAENGWSRFAFKIQSSPPPPLLPGGCAVCDGALHRDITGTSWEVVHGSSEFTQTVHLVPGNSNTSRFMMSLPLPGPNLVGAPFPQEAYFEITILHSQQDPSSSLPEEDTKHKHKHLVMSLGLSVSNPRQNSSLSGTYPGSIGFHSNGSVYLDGMKLVIETERSEWAGVNRVIGCGFDPRKKKVYFTVDSHMMHAINCNSEQYVSPLYPVMDANFDAMVMVNLGQSRFKYGPANARRTSNPCFIKSGSGEIGSSVAGYDDDDHDHDDSGELFSMDSGWFETPKKNNKSKRGNGNDAMDIDADSDLFEISLKD